MFKVQLIRIAVAGLLTFLIITLIDSSFKKYQGSAQLFVKQKVSKYWYDLDGDNTTETVLKWNIDGKHAYKEIWRDKSLVRVEHFNYKMFQNRLIVGDYNHDGQAEDYQISRKKDSCFLQTSVYQRSSPKCEAVNKTYFLFKFKDSLSNVRFYHLSLHDLNQDGFDEVIFLIQRGFAHRQIGIYDIRNEKLNFSETAFMYITQLRVKNLDDDPANEILFASYANGNVPPYLVDTVSQTFDIEQDTLYSDLNSYIGIMDDDFKSKLITHKEGFTSMLRFGLIIQNNQKQLVTIESSMNDTSEVPILKIIDFKGTIIAETELPFSGEMKKFSRYGGSHIKVLQDKDEQKIYIDALSDSIYEYDTHLNLVNSHYFQGFHEGTRLTFYDLNEDGEKELICNVVGGFMIFQKDFEDGIFLPCNSPAPINSDHLEPYMVNGTIRGYVFGNKKSSYLFKFQSNPYYNLKYLLYVGIFISFFFLVYVLQKLQTIQLEKENRKLEEMVQERTTELRSKNEQLKATIDEVEVQKSIIEEKNLEILDSISYAKRIQTAILPPKKIVKEYLPESFVLYKPKDIVAGDFYWMQPIGNKVLFAACDCTGHGVPGAMVSVVCNNGLNRAVREYGLTDPGKILEKTRSIVIGEFEKSEDKVKDGMDVALCSLEDNKLKFAGAHNPLWIIRKDSNEIEEIKGDKQPIGIFSAQKPFKTHEVELNKGDTVYVFSDGYADQFGGEKGKKFKAKNFKDLLISIQEEDMSRQRELIDQTFEKWKGNIEQLDDVCVIGVRV